MTKRFDNRKTKYFLPNKIVSSEGFSNPELLLTEKPMCVSFHTRNNAIANGKGSSIVLDFGKELCGGIRILTRTAGEKGTKLRLSFGESLCEATSTIGFKNATNDHSPRDIEVTVSALSDLSFGQTGFRFARIEVLDEQAVNIQSIWAFCVTDKLSKSGSIISNDTQLNKILKTAEYTLRLNMQNGYIWDGVKRDRLVWSGDLNQEIITSFYCYGETDNVYNSLSFLKEQYKTDEWINGIMSYSAWWVINLCAYCRFYKEKEYLVEDEKYAISILNRIDDCIDQNGNMDFGGDKMDFFLDHPTFGMEDTAVGVASLLVYTANLFESVFGKNIICKSIREKLSRYLLSDCTHKQVRAMQILAGRVDSCDAEMLSKDGAKGFSTFMAYYILTALAKAGGKDTIEIIKSYFGAMLSVGATTFFEDFDIEWTKNCGRIDKLPENGQLDIHGDFGKYCYEGFRHSLCHGWASGVYAFVIENIVGVKVYDQFKKITVKPNLCGLLSIKAVIPSKYGKITVSVKGKKIKVDAPKEIEVEILQ